MTLSFLLLGSLEVVSGTAPVTLGDTRERHVLALLAVQAGQPVPVPRLIAALWDGEPPVTAHRQVQNAVSRLRRTLAPQGDDGGTPLVVTESSGYRLAVRAGAVDALVFRARVAQARAAQDGARAAALLRSALNLWRGPFLGGLTGRVLGAVATEWEERRQAAEIAYYDRMLGLGRHAEITGGLTAIAADDPLREDAAARLMLALYRSGRAPDALRAYQATRAALAGELGLDPGAGLTRLRDRILARDPALDRAVPGGSVHAVPRARWCGLAGNGHPAT